MSVIKKAKMSIARKSANFLAFAFTFTWVIEYMLWRNGTTGLSDARAYSGFMLATLAPGLAAVSCALLFEKGQRLKVLGLRFRPNIWWLVALLAPLLFGLIFVATRMVLSGGNLLIVEQWRAPLAALLDNPVSSQISNIALAILVMTFVHLVTEELGWRGYLYHLWRHFGFWRCAIAIGLLHGFWHWPMIWFFGLDGGDRIHGLIEHPLMSALLSVYFTLIRDRSRSVFAAAIFHASWNSVSNFGSGKITVIAMLVLGLPLIAWMQKQQKCLTEGAF